MEKLKNWAELERAFPMVLMNGALNIEANEKMYMFQSLPQEFNHVCGIDEDIEILQWFAIDTKGDTNAEMLRDNYGLYIFWSDILQCYILAVDHYGTPWEDVKLDYKEIINK